jgi:1,4-dihydroxy-6-naphthoate synthase
MYVNDWTVDYGPKGREAVRTLLTRGFEEGLIPGPIDVQFVG